MERVAIFVDAGYFWVQVSHIIFGEKRNRDDIVLDAKSMRHSLLRETKKQFPNYALLRIYWYDGYGDNGLPTQQHKELSRLDDIKMRFGTRNKNGEQKGVDGLLMADLIVLAQNKAISSALIISGDGDLVPGINAAQTLGVRIHRLEINSYKASSPYLRECVDKNCVWDNKSIQEFAKNASLINDECEIKDSDSLLNEEDKSTLMFAARNFISSMTEEEKREILSQPSIPSAKDKILLYAAKQALARRLSPEEKIFLRAHVRKFLDG